MGLKSEIEKAYIDSLGVDPENSGNIPQLAEDLSNAITNFLLKQTFTITEMKAILEVEEMKTSTTLPADVLAGRVKSLGTGYSGFQVQSTSTSGTQAVRIPALELRKFGGQGGSMQSKGHAYIGNNPIDSSETNERNTKVRLLKQNIRGK